MDIKKFRFWNNIVGWALFLVAAVTYILTIEPTVSFWDCGEFITSSYKLEVGHPPGNPTFQIIARIFTLFSDAHHAAAAVNVMSGICSALCILFLFWTITHLGRRLCEIQWGVLDWNKAIVIFASGTIGALAYTWSDTFWFSAVEAEVYAMSSMFTAVVVWLMLKWEESSEEEHANRWIVLIAYLMGLSIGVHLLNLLTIPALVFIYYYKRYNYSFKGAFCALLLSGVIVAVILWGIIPYVPRLAGFFDRIFVNGFGMSFNSGVVVFLLLLFAALFFGIYRSYNRGKVLLNTILLCCVVILIGYSTFAMVIIRSSANTPTNEYQPDNPYNLQRYITREQYGKTPLLYGAPFNMQPIDYYSNPYYAKIGKKYVKSKGMEDYVYESQDKMFFPRMHSRGESQVSYYSQYMRDPSSKPTAFENMTFFVHYQLNYMYWRYFFWNFVGRQNDVHGSTPSDILRGNWESGIPIIDKIHLGDMSKAPDMMKNNKGRNHFFFLPLLLGIFGLLYQLKHDKRNCWITFLLFVLTGIAIVVYLNQPPFQPRERDYAYAGSFYAFSIWIGLGVMAVAGFISKKLPEKVSVIVASVLCLIVPIQMVSQTWDDHDRSGRYSVREMGRNYIESCKKNAILITHGDNDTFPLWYSQEVEGVRPDVRIMNTSLMGVDWYIDQMQCKCNDSEPIKFTIPKSLYLYGVNDIVPIYEELEGRFTVKQVVGVLASPDARTLGSDGELQTYLPTRKLRLKVDKENALQSGIVSPVMADSIPDYIDFNIPKGKTYLTKFEMMFLDMLSSYDWTRPIYIINRKADLNIGLDDYFQPDGMVYRFVPYKVKGSDGFEYMDEDDLYNTCMNVYTWEGLNDPDTYVDYQNIYTFGASASVRDLYVKLAQRLILTGKDAKAMEILDKVMEIMPSSTYPLYYAFLPSYNEYAVEDIVESYLFLSNTGFSEAKDKAIALADEYLTQVYDWMVFFLQPRGVTYLSKQDGEAAIAHYYQVVALLKEYLSEEEIKPYEDKIDTFLAPFVTEEK